MSHVNLEDAARRPAGVVSLIVVIRYLAGAPPTPSSLIAVLSCEATRSVAIVEMNNSPTACANS